MILKIFLLLSYVVQCLSEPDRREITSLKHSKFRVKPTVVNGSPASSAQIPFLVSIKEPAKIEGTVIVWANLCGGSILRDHRVLTAAHCFEMDNFLYAKRPYILRVVAGNIKTNLRHTGISGSSINGTQWRRVVGLRLHEHFNFPSNDIAIVYVDYPWVFNTDIIRPVALASSTTDNLGSCITAGYGRMGHKESDKTSAILLVASIDTISRSKCSLFWGINMDKFVCSLSARSDVSEGDSGSPLACLYPGKGQDVLVGVVSGKNFDKTTLFTRVSEYHDWIDSDSLADNAGRALGSDLRCALVILTVSILKYEF